MKELIKPQAVSSDNNELYTALCEVYIEVCDCKGGSGTKWFADDDQNDIIF